MLSSACVNKPIENQVNTESEIVQISETVSEPSSEEQLYEKYADIISSLEEENYDNAIDIINEKKTEANKEKYGDIEEYLVTVELTPDNFDEYFEFVTSVHYTAFGTEDLFLYGLKSKMYDSGLIIYDLNNAEYNDDIAIGYKWSMGDVAHSDGVSDYLRNLLRIGNGMNIMYKDLFKAEPLGKIAGTKLTFIEKDYVESYEIDSRSADLLGNTTITLKNGEIIKRQTNPDFPY